MREGPPDDGAIGSGGEEGGRRWFREGGDGGYSLRKGSA